MTPEQSGGLLIVLGTVIVLLIVGAIIRSIMQSFYTMGRWYKRDGELLLKVICLPLFLALFLFTIVFELITARLLLDLIFGTAKKRR